MRKAGNIVPDNSLEWPEFVISELVSRIPEVESRIQKYEPITNKRGNALSLVILENARCFVPIVIKDWELKPMDILIAKQGTATKYKYLSRRNILKLTASTALGNNMSNQSSGGASDAFINFFSPSGSGNNSSGMTYSNMGKSANYLFNELKNRDCIKFASRSLVESYEPKVLGNAAPTSMLVTKKASGEYELFFPGKSEGTVVGDNVIRGILDKLPENERYSKTASLEREAVLSLGYQFPRYGNILQEPMPDDEPNPSPIMKYPLTEGIFMHKGSPTYINPDVRYLNGEKSTYKLGVKNGKYTYAKEFSGYKPNTAADSSMQSREELLPEVTKFEKGKTYCIYSDHDSTVTMPFKLISAYTVGQANDLVINARPIIGDNVPVKITFKNVIKPISADAYTYIYPDLTSRVCHLPDNYTEQADLGETYSGNDFIKVTVDRVNDRFTFREQNNTVSSMTTRGPFTKGQFFNEMVNRYGFDIEQAKKYEEQLKRQLAMNFIIRTILTEMDSVAKINDSAEPNSREKAALEPLLKMASKLARISEGLSKHASDCRAAERDYDNFYRYIISKKAALETQDVQNNAQDRVDMNDRRMGANTGGGAPGLMQSLLSINKVEKHTRDVIDSLLYMYKTDYKQEEYNRIMSKLRRTLEEAENDLCKIMLLCLLNKIPGQDYEEIRILVADIDSYLSSLESSMVLIGV